MTTPDDTGELSAVFELLSDETRVRIVRELATSRGALSFSDLRSRVGVRDAGRFNYHLGRLRGRLVEKTDGGYALTERGTSVAATLVARPA